MGATWDDVDPAHSRWMSTQVQHGSYHHCEKGSHGALWDDTAAFAGGLLALLDAVERGERTIRFQATDRDPEIPAASRRGGLSSFRRL